MPTYSDRLLKKERNKIWIIVNKVRQNGDNN